MSMLILSSLWVLYVLLSSGFVVTTLHAAHAPGDSDHDAACLAKGFNAASLKCSACPSVAKILHIDDITKACEDCCTELPRVGASYKRAILEVDKRFLLMYPKIEALITRIDEAKTSKSKSKKEHHPYSLVEPRYKFGVRPIIHFYSGDVVGDEDDDADGVEPEPDESVEVGGWSADVLHDFLKDNLQ
jgi:hypothetical protein